MTPKGASRNQEETQKDPINIHLFEARLAFSGFDYKNALKHARSAKRLAKETGKTGSHCLCVLTEAEYLAAQGKAAAATKLIKEAVRIADAADNQYMATKVRMRAGGILFRLLHFQAAEELVYEKVACQTDYPELAAGGLAIIGHIREFRGRISEALVWFKEYADLCESSGHLGECCYAVLEMARLNAHRGDYVQSLEQLDLVEKWAVKHKFKRTIVEVALRRSEVYFAVGHPIKTIEVMGNASKLIKKSILTPLVNDMKDSFGDSLIRMGDLEGALNYYSFRERLHSKSGTNNLLIIAMLKKAEVLNGLHRYVEALNQCWKITDFLEGRYEDLALILSKTLAQIRLSLTHLCRTKEGIDAMRFASDIRDLADSAGWLANQKQLSISELLEQVTSWIAITRKEMDHPFEFRGRRVDPATREIYINGENQNETLTITEYSIWYELSKQQGTAMGEEELAGKLRDSLVFHEKTVRRRTVHNHIVKIRKKLQDPTIIKTERGVGWLIPLE